MATQSKGTTTFAGLTGAKAGDGKPGPIEGESTQAGAPEGTTEVTQDAATGNQTGAAESESTGVQDATGAETVLAAVELAQEVQAPIRTSVDTSTETPTVGVVAALDQQPDADTAISHSALAQEQIDQQANLFDTAAADAPFQALYSSSIPNLSLGKYQFERGQLKFDNPADAADFEDLMDQQPIQIKNQVRKVNAAAANAYLTGLLQGRVITGVDTSANTLQAPNTRNNGG